MSETATPGRRRLLAARVVWVVVAVLTVTVASVPVLFERFNSVCLDAPSTRWVVFGTTLAITISTNLEALNAVLLSALRETMQPAHVSLWLFSREDRVE